MRISRADADALLAHARSGYPHEVCGVLVGATPGGGAARVARVVPVTNRETERPAVRYQIAPEDLIAVQKAARTDGLDILGYYHSHPDHPARPSETDLTVPVTTISCSGKPIPRNWTDNRFSRRGSSPAAASAARATCAMP